MFAALLPLAVERELQGVADWWTVVELMSYTPSAELGRHVERFASACVHAPQGPFMPGAAIHQWIWLGRELACLLIRLQAYRREAAAHGLCDDLLRLFSGGQGTVQLPYVSQDFVQSWADHLRALGQLPMTDATRGRVVATADWLAC